MYEIKLNGEYLYFPADAEYIVYQPKLVQALNDAGYLEFDIPDVNPNYGKLSVRQGEIVVLKDGEAVFTGEVREISEGIYFQKHVYAVGELAFLYDSIQPQRRFQCSPLEMFTALLAEHNSQVEAGKRFSVGMVTVTDSNDYIYRYTNYEDTLSVLRGDLCESLGGYLRVRYQNGVRYLDLVKLEDYGKLSTQEIRFGENILEYANNLTSDTIATAVIPLGAKLEESVVEGLDAYTTIESVNDGVNYVYNQSAVDRFGWIKVVKKWEDVTVPANLKKKAEEWLTSVQYAELSFELTAVDLSMLDSSIQSYEVGDRVPVVCDIYGVNTVVPVYKKETVLDDLSQNRILLGSTVQQAYTTQNSNRAAELEKQLPQETSILQAAKENATAMLTGANGGYILFGLNDEGQICELFITDHPDKTKAQRVWRFNLNGLGYSSTGIDGTYGLAITADGAIVADFITAGTLNAELIKAGILTDKKGNFYLNLTSGVLKGSFSELAISGSPVATQSYAESEASSAAKKAVDGQTQTDIFNKLTNNGQTQGIYLKNGKLYINANYIGAGTISAELIKAGILTDEKGQFSLNMKTGALTMNSGTFKGTLSSAKGTISDGTGTLSLSSGNLYMKNSRSDGPGLFAEKSGSDLYSCWGAKNSAARKDGSYRETNTINVIKAGENESDERLKQDIEDLEADYCKSLIFGIKPKRFSYKKHPDELELGVIAQDIAKVQEEYGITKRNWLCYKNDDDMYEVEYKQLIAPIIRVVQDQQEQIERLKERINGDV